MLELTNVKIVLNKNNKVLIDNLNLKVGDSDKLAIIGEEGDGKSTLLRAIASKESVHYATISGNINSDEQKIGYVGQFLESEWNEQVIMSYFLKDNANDLDDYENYSKYNLIKKYWSLFNLKKEILDSEQRIETLSGGEKIKMRIIKALIGEPQILLLDEPTNDLDIDTYEWLENFIKNWNKPIIFISHDEKFLENTANAILHIERTHKKQNVISTYEHLPYREYVAKRQRLFDRQTQIATKERAEDKEKMAVWQDLYKKVEYDLRTVSRQCPHVAANLKAKMKNIKAQEKRFENERSQFLDIPEKAKSIKVNLSEVDLQTKKEVLHFENESIIIPNHNKIDNINLHIMGAEKVAIIGNNGIGKTTLIKKIYNYLIDKKDLKIGYMPQNYEEILDKNSSVISFLSSFCFDKNEMTLARTYLGGLKFTNDEVMGDISELSGGQKAKLFLLKMIIGHYELLVLDEPTRNLSPLSSPAFCEALKNFNGAIIFISHDRKFVSEVATKIYELTSMGLIERDNV